MTLLVEVGIGAALGIEVLLVIWCYLRLLEWVDSRGPK